LEILGLFIAKNLRHMGAIAAVVLAGFVVLVLIGTFVAEEWRQRNIKRPAVSGTESDRDSTNQRAA
jgi:hypothetical protein